MKKEAIDKTEDLNLIAELQKIQERKEFLPKKDLISLSLKTGMPLTSIYGVATFYAQFKLEKPAKYKVYVCDGTACHVRHSTDLLTELQKELKIKINETTNDGLFTIETVRCLGLCASAPVMKINDDVFPKVTKGQIKTILEKYKQNEK